MTSVMNHDDLLAGPHSLHRYFCPGSAEEASMDRRGTPVNNRDPTWGIADLERLIYNNPWVKGDRSSAQMGVVTARGCMVIACHMDFDSSKRKCLNTSHAARPFELLPAC